MADSTRDHAVAAATPGMAWATELAAYAEMGFTPRTSEATRREGRLLVLVSAIALLLAVSMVTVTEGSVAGIKLLPSTPSAVAFVAGVGVAYLLVAYLLDVFRDQRMATFHNEERDQLGLRVGALSRAYTEAIEAQGGRERFVERVRITGEALEAALQEADAAGGVWTPEMSERVSSARRAWQEAVEWRDWGIRMTTIDLDHRHALLESAIDDAARIDRWRARFEVVLPTALATVAIVASIVRFVAG